VVTFEIETVAQLALDLLSQAISGGPADEVRGNQAGSLLGADDPAEGLALSSSPSAESSSDSSNGRRSSSRDAVTKDLQRHNRSPSTGTIDRPGNDDRRPILTDRERCIDARNCREARTQYFASYR
jgi:hypothetical protein